MKLICLIFLFTSIIQAQNVKFQHTYKFKEEIDEIQKMDSQTAAFFYATIGKHKESLLTWDKSFNYSNGQTEETETNNLKKKYVSTQALEAIVSMANKTDYVVLNEEHHRPDHRIFAQKLLKPLFDKGYRNLAIETLSTSDIYADTLLNQRKYPKVTSGSYSREPQFGEFIRKALKIGFYVFPYDDISLSGKKREEVQARNIIKNKREGKTFIYCGFQHALEGNIDHWEKAMAQNIKEITGSDPLTIDQTHFSGRSIGSNEHPLYNYYASDEPIALIDKAGNYFKNKENGGYYDISIFHPKSKDTLGRPVWLFTKGKKSISINEDFLKQLKPPFLLFAFRKEEDYDIAVPVDLIQIDSLEKPVHLALEKGYYNLIITNQAKESYVSEIEVK